MALCLAISLIACHDFVPYDQLVRYKWWHKNGYMSSTGKCFDIGAATSQSLSEFERRQDIYAEKHRIPLEDMDSRSHQVILDQFDVNCSDENAAGNGGLMRLAPVPLFCYRVPNKAVEYSGISAKITHGDQRAYDACRFYGSLIVAALNGETKDQLLDENFYQKHKEWFHNKPLHKDIQTIAEGSYKKKKRGYDDGIRGKGFVVNSLEAALWAFWSDDNSFKKGVLAAVNLGDDTDTTAAIYGQLAGAYYGYKKLPREWAEQVYAKNFIRCLSEWIGYEGQIWSQKKQSTSANSHSSSGNHSDASLDVTSSIVHLEHKNPSKEEVPKKSRK
jgi:ADP-ribosylglycohydrolase